jgi:hypothetical protein
MGAPVGNRNAAKAKVWHAAIMRALERRKPANERIAAIDELADKLLDLVAAGDLAALKEFGDRLDGKPAQSVSVDGDGEGGPIKTLNEIVIRAVDAAGN